MTVCIVGELADHALEPEFLVELLLEFDVGPGQSLLLRRLVDDRPKFADVERLGQVGGGAGLHRGDGRLDGAVAGEDDDLGVGQLALGLGQDFKAADVPHDQVADDDVERLLLDQPQPFSAAGGDDAFVADARKAFGHGLGVGFVVVDHEDANLLIHRTARSLQLGGKWLVARLGVGGHDGLGGAGRRIENREPLSGTLSTSIDPP